MNDTAKYEERIAALLAKAESTTPEEAELLTAKAEELMIKYGIEQAVIDAKRLGNTAPEKIVTEKIYFTGIYSAGMVMMGHYVATALGQLRTLQSKNNTRFNPATGKREKADVLYVIGFESDVKQAVLLITSLQLQAVSAMAAWWRTFDEARYLTGMEKFKEKRQFVISFGAGASERIKETRRRVVQEETAKGTGTELVLVDRKSQVDRFTEDKYNPRTTRSRGLDGGSYGGGSAGRAAGRNANVGGTGISGGRKAVGR